MAPPTDLEALIQHLAGRAIPAAQGPRDPADSLASRLDDPTSDASRFLDEIRQKTRALLDEPDDDGIGPGSGLGTPAAAPSPATSRAGGGGGRRRDPALWAALIGGTLLGGALGATGARIADRAEARRADDRDDRLLALVRAEFAAGRGPFAAPVADPGALPMALARVGDRLDRLDRGLTTLARPPDPVRPAERDPPEPGRPAPGVAGPGASPALDATLAGLAADLAAVRREVGLSEAATGRQIQEMRTVLQEVNTVVRRVLSRPQNDNVANITAPLIALAAQALTNNLQHPSAQVRGEAVEQLMRLGAPARTALPALQHRLNLETDSNVRTTIQAALNVLSSN